MNREIKEKILSEIKDSGRIMLFRHIRNDGDCVGATKGLKAIIKATWPEKDVRIIDADCADYLKFLGPDDEPVADEVYGDALAVVLDTATADRISNQKYALCRRVIKIDHHIPVDNYGDVNWVEEKRTSCCEMIVDFYETFRGELTLNAEAAKYLYTGMVTDSGRFRYSGVSGDTLRRAATLLDVGIDTETLYAQLYLEDFNELQFRADISRNIKMTENGVLYLYLDQKTQKKYQLTRDQASACISLLDSVRGSIVWLAFIENGDEESTIRVRLRSRFVHINTLAEKYRGGGHACASGATVYNADEMAALIADADALVKEYKETHEGWL